MIIVICNMNYFCFVPLILPNNQLLTLITCCCRFQGAAGWKLQLNSLKLGNVLEVVIQLGTAERLGTEETAL